MKKSFVLLLFAFSFVVYSNAQNVGIGTTNPLEKLSVGTNSEFRVDNQGNITRIRNINYSFPTVQGTNQYLKNDGAGNLTWEPAPRPVVRSFSIVNNNMTAWAIDNAADYQATPFNLNPILVLYRGFTYEFKISAPGHPFRIALSNGGAAYTAGISVNDVQTGTITFTVPMDAPNTLFYYCLVHSPMNGTLIIR
jgi:hypothetical protein